MSKNARIAFWVLLGAALIGLVVIVNIHFFFVVPEQKRAAEAAEKQVEKAEAFPSDSLPTLSPSDDITIDDIGRRFTIPDEANDEQDYMDARKPALIADYVWEVREIEYENSEYHPRREIIFQRNPGGQRLSVVVVVYNSTDNISMFYYPLVKGDMVKFGLARSSRKKINTGGMGEPGYEESIYLVPNRKR